MKILFVAEQKDDERAFNQALSLAKNMQASLSVLSIVDCSNIWNGVDYYSELSEIIAIRYENSLKAMVQDKTIAGAPIETKVLLGRKFIKIIQEVQNNDYDLVIKAHEKVDSVSDRLLGGTDMKINATLSLSNLVD